MPADTVFELRNYTLQPGKRDVLIDLFEREFTETQEDVGAHVLATFRDLDDPDRFVWIRGFANMSARAAALEAFYTGPVWQTHRNAANATIIDSDNVLLLRAFGAGALRNDRVRPPIGAREIPSSVFLTATYFPREKSAFPDLFAQEIAPALRAAGGDTLATFATEHSANSYPRLPVRENETVFVSLTRFASPEAAAKAAIPALERHLTAPTHVMRLQPTARSQTH